MDTIIKGATAVHTFSLPKDIGTVKLVKVVYTQNQNIVAIRSFTSDEVATGSFTVELPPSVTGRLMDRSKVTIWLKAYYPNGAVAKSERMTRMVEE